MTKLFKGSCDDLVLDAIRVYLHRIESIDIYHRDTTDLWREELIIRDAANLIACMWRENGSVCTDCVWCNKITVLPISDPNLLDKVAESIRLHRSHLFRGLL